MSSRLRTFLDFGFLRSARKEHVPHEFARADITGTGIRLLLTAIGVMVLWSCAMLLGIRPIGKTPVGWLVYALVMSECIVIFQLRQDLKGERGIGWQGALITGVVTVSAFYIATALSSH